MTYESQLHCFGKALGRVLLLFAAVILSQHASAEQVNVAVAANFMKPMASLKQRFEQQSGHKLSVAFGSSGRLYAQISNGAPFDVFLSADEAKPRALEAAKLTSVKPQVYAAGRLALWSRDSQVKVQGLETLRSPLVAKIAVANPRIAPYGLAAIQVLERAELYPLLKSKIVMGENIAQAYQFAFTGNAQLGFVALSQVLETAKSEDYWLVPQELHDPILQSAVVLRRAEKNTAALAFFDFLLSPAASELIAEFGYQSLDSLKSTP